MNKTTTSKLTRYATGCIRACLLCACLLLNTQANAEWFRTPEQAAVDNFEQGNYDDAAAGFTDTYRRGVALYRAGRYTEAGAALASVEREEVKADALYNLGNSHYKRSDYEGAVNAYEAALKLRPNDEDTLHNFALAKQMVEQSLTETLQDDETEEPAEEESEEKSEEESKEESEEEQESEDSSGEQEQESEESSGEQEQESEESSGEQEQESEESSGEQEQESEESSGEQQQESEESSGEQEQESEESSGEQEQESEESSGEQE
ncbi:MAG: tetratricopeptide repeat protein, partial [Pseudomonadota bacterium]